MRHNEIHELFEELSFPLTTEALVSAAGDEELEYPEGTETVEDICERVTLEEFESSEDATLVFRSALSEEAIGRKGYSDRDPPTIGESKREYRSF